MVASPTTQTCPNCSAQVPLSATYCNCGYKFVSDRKPCPKCSAFCLLDEPRCTACGHWFPKPAPTAPAVLTQPIEVPAGSALRVIGAGGLVIGVLMVLYGLVASPSIGDALSKGSPMSESRYLQLAERISHQATYTQFGQWLSIIGAIFFVGGCAIGAQRKL